MAAVLLDILGRRPTLLPCLFERNIHFEIKTSLKLVILMNIFAFCDRIYTRVSNYLSWIYNNMGLQGVSLPISVIQTSAITLNPSTTTTKTTPTTSTTPTTPTTPTTSAKSTTTTTPTTTAGATSSCPAGFTGK